MPNFAARRTDATAHGGSIVDGEPTVRIGGERAARLDDPHTCPLTTGDTVHVGGVVTSSSRTVRIGNRHAARLGDSCDCNTVGTVGSGVGSRVGSEELDTDQDGRVDTVRDADALSSARGNGGREAWDRQWWYVDAERRARVGAWGVNLQQGGEVGVFRERSRRVGEAETSREGVDTPDTSEQRAGRLMEELGVQAGDDGRQIGVGWEARAGGEIFNEQEGILVSEGPVSLDASMDYGVGLAIQREQRYYYDRADGSLHIVDGAGIPGLELGWQVHLAIRIHEPAATAGVPNKIVEGCPTVRIG